MEDREIKAMAAIANALSEFGESESGTINRILQWASSRYGITGIERSVLRGSAPVSPQRTESPRFETAADLFDAASPTSGGEKAVVIGYWFQNVQGQPDFGSQEVNTTLKNIGHGVTNITDAFTSAISRKPAWVLQTQKTGSSRQARKQYKLTVAGVRWVEARLAGTATTDENSESNGQTINSTAKEPEGNEQ